MSIKIIAVSERWVFVGYSHTSPTGDVRLTDARCIRVWGTVSGIGQLAAGPTAKTVLDPIGTMDIRAGAILFDFEGGAAWEKHLKPAK